MTFETFPVCLFIERDGSWDLLALAGFDICVDEDHLVVCNARVYFYVINKGGV